MQIFFGVLTVLALVGMILFLARKAKRRAGHGGTGSGAGGNRPSGLQ